MQLNQPVSRLKSAALLTLLYPVITLVLLTVVRPIPFLGIISDAAFFFSAPGVWISNIHTFTAQQKIIALWAHYPILGFVIGYIYPFEPTLSSNSIKKITLRYGYCLSLLIAIGFALFFYAAKHDS